MNTGEVMHIVLIIAFTPITVGVMVAILWWFMKDRDAGSHADRVADIWARRDEWGETTCRQLIEGNLASGMTPEMVRLAWGEPTAISTADGEIWQYTDNGDSTATFMDGALTAWTGTAPRPSLGFSGRFVIIVITLLIIMTTILIFAVILLL